MGDASGRDDDAPLHQVTLTRAFLIGAHPVTVRQFTTFVNETGHVTSAEKARRAQGPAAQNYRWIDGANWRTAWPSAPDDTPVVCVSWLDAIAFCEWLGRRFGRKVTLPTEARWEYACRAGTDGPFNAPGSVHDLGWVGGNSGDQPFDGQALAQRSGHAYFERITAERGRPHRVGQKKPNRWGLYDMHGNVWEWCLDAVGTYPNHDVVDPTGPDLLDPKWGQYRRARGGDWYDPPSIASSFNRGWWNPKVGYTHLGFRVVQEV